jgi:hypothetical protein
MGGYTRGAKGAQALENQRAVFTYVLSWYLLFHNNSYKSISYDVTVAFIPEFDERKNHILSFRTHNPKYLHVQTEGKHWRESIDYLFIKRIVRWLGVGANSPKGWVKLLRIYEVDL